ncbi:MAG: hypothetical protein ACREV2_16205 [Burkholderiales bacterium]
MKLLHALRLLLDVFGALFLLIILFGAIFGRTLPYETFQELGAFGFYLALGIGAIIWIAWLVYFGVSRKHDLGVQNTEPPL